MMKKIILTIIIFTCLVGCSNYKSANTEIDNASSNMISAVPSITPAQQTTPITITNAPTNQASITNKPNLTEEWKPNHGIVNITYNKVDKYDDKEEYIFISSTVGWKAYTKPVGAGQIYIELYKTTDGGNHWDEIASSNDPSTTIGGGELIFINSKVGWIVKFYPRNGVLTLDKTLDGGLTWETQYVKTPSVYSDINFFPGLPVFFSKNDGILFASCLDTISNKYVDSVAFITHDGGETWSIKSKDESDESFSWSIDQQTDSTNEFEVKYDHEVWTSTDGIQWESQ